MKHSLASLALVATVGLALAGCSSPQASSPAAPNVAPVGGSTPTPSASATAEAKKSSRGNLIKALGQGAGTFDPVTKKQLSTFVVKSIEPVKCTEPYATPAENGHLYAVDISIVTTPELADQPFPEFWISSNDFKFIDPATGTTYNGNLSSVATFSCLPSTALIPQGGVGPDEKVTGKIILDLPATKGTLVLQNAGSGGWEYSF
jgi:hypothetical protein